MAGNLWLHTINPKSMYLWYLCFLGAKVGGFGSTFYSQTKAIYTYTWLTTGIHVVNSIFYNEECYHYYPGGGFQYVYFHPYLGKISNLINIFQMGWNHQPVICYQAHQHESLLELTSLSHWGHPLHSLRRDGQAVWSVCLQSKGHWNSGFIGFIMHVEKSFGGVHVILKHIQILRQVLWPATFSKRNIWTFAIDIQSISLLQGSKIHHFGMLPMYKWARNRFPVLNSPQILGRLQFMVDVWYGLWET